MSESPADAVLLIAPGCAHCPAVLEDLAKLVKRGAIGRLEVVNIQVYPDRARDLGARSVPWVRIGRFELEGAYGYAELAHWAEHAARGTGLGEYYGRLLESRQLDRVVSMLRQDRHGLLDLVGLLAREETPMGVRIGIGAVFEELQGSGLLDLAIPELGKLIRSEGSNIRGDACHYLGLTGSRGAIALVRPLLDDPSPHVREIAAETLELLEKKGR